MGDKAFDLMEKMYSEMQNGFSKIDEQFGTVSNRLDKVESKLDKVESRLGKIEMKIDGEITPKIVELEDGYKVNYELAVETRDNVEALRKDISTVEIVTANNYADLEKLNAVR